MPSNHLFLYHPLILLPSIFPNIRVFSNESTLSIRWPKYWSFSFNISPSNELPGLISPSYAFYSVILNCLQLKAVSYIPVFVPAVSSAWNTFSPLFFTWLKPAYPLSFSAGPVFSLFVFRMPTLILQSQSTYLDSRQFKGRETSSSSSSL